LKIQDPVAILTGNSETMLQPVVVDIVVKSYASQSR
jgi:hypothetical protein